MKTALALLAISLLTTPAFAKMGTSVNDTKRTDTSSNEPAGFVLIEEQVSVDMGKLPLVFMNDARTDFMNKNYGEASSDLKAASRVIAAELRQTKDTAGSEHLRAAQQQLDQLAIDVRNEKITASRDLDSRLAQITYHKAENDQARASSQWARNEYKGTGYDLRLAADEIEQSARWAGKQLDKGAMATVEDVRRVSNKLVEGSKWTSSEVRTALNDFRSAAQRFAKNSNMQDRGGTESATTRSMDDSNR